MQRIGYRDAVARQPESLADRPRRSPRRSRRSILRLSPASPSASPGSAPATRRRLPAPLQLRARRHRAPSPIARPTFTARRCGRGRVRRPVRLGPEPRDRRVIMTRPPSAARGVCRGGDNPLRAITGARASPRTRVPTTARVRPAIPACCSPSACSNDRCSAARTSMRLERACRERSPHCSPRSSRAGRRGGRPSR